MNSKSNSIDEGRVYNHYFSIIYLKILPPGILNESTY